MTEIVGFIEPAEVFQYYLEEIIVRDFYCVLGISSPVGSFPGENAVGLGCLSNIAVCWKRGLSALYRVQKMDCFCLLYCFLPFEHRNKAYFFFPEPLFLPL